MKRLLIVCILAALLCAGLAMLVQSCAPVQEAAPPAAESAQEGPTPTPSEATPVPAGAETAQDELPAPDLRGTIEAIDGATLLLAPVRVTVQGEGWAVA